MLTVWKYTINSVESLIKTFQMPMGARPIHLKMREEIPSSYPVIDMWFLVDTDRAMEDREFSVIGTGHPIPTQMDFGWTLTDYVGTIMPQQNLVLHIFETTQPTNTSDRKERTPWLPV